MERSSEIYLVIGWMSLSKFVYFIATSTKENFLSTVRAFSLPNNVKNVHVEQTLHWEQFRFHDLK